MVHSRILAAVLNLEVPEDLVLNRSADSLGMEPPNTVVFLSEIVAAIEASDRSYTCKTLPTRKKEGEAFAVGRNLHEHLPMVMLVREVSVSAIDM